MEKARIIVLMEKIKIQDLNNTKMTMNFIEFPWHDAILKEIKIDRSNPGINDMITLVVIWDTGSESIFYFKDVYYAKLDLNFGVIADECISEVRYLPTDDNDVVPFIRKWQSLVEDIANLFFIQIKTISTASSIRIFAKNIVEVKCNNNV